MLSVLWHTDRDRFEEGQWLRGRVYERRADLSPSGEKLVYFAAKWERREVATWTALSKPPWLTALAVWPKGDAWGGGGLFESERSLALNHPYGALRMAEGSRLPPRTAVRELGLFGGGGEDFPLYEMRLLRDGWRLVHRPRSRDGDFTRSPVWHFDPPWEYARPRPLAPELELRMRILAIHERAGPSSGGDWYVVEHRVVDRMREPERVVLDLGRSEWADWDRSGDLLFARDGVVHRLRRRDPLALEHARALIDLRDRTFVAREAPPEATRW